MKWITLFLLFAANAGQAQDSLNRDYFDSVLRSHCPSCTGADAGPAARAFHEAHKLVRQTRYDEAFPFINTTLDEATHAHQPLLIYFGHLLKATLFQARRLYPDALAEYRQAIMLGRSDHRPLLTESYVGIGLLFFEREVPDSAYHYYSLAESSLDAASSPLVRKNLYANLSLYYSRREEWDKADAYAQRSLRIETALGNLYGIAASYLGIGTLYYNRYKDGPAIRYYLKSLDLSRRYEYAQIRQYAAANLASLYSEKGDYRTAFTYLKEADEAKDSVHGRDKFMGLMEQQKKYELSLKQAQIARLEVERAARLADARQREWRSRIYLAAGLFLLVLTAVILAAYRQKIAAGRAIEAQKDQLDELNRTKDQLFSIIAHDLRAPVQGLNHQLSALKQALANHDTGGATLLTGKIEQASNNTSALLNNLLYWSLQQTGGLTFHPERLRAKALADQVCYDYLPVAQAKELSLVNEVSDEIYIQADLNVIRLILRNLIDNAIKFTPRGGSVHIEGRCCNDACILTVRDTGIGMKEEVRQASLGHGRRVQADSEGRRGTGLGLSLVRSMLERSGGRLEIDSGNNGTSMIIYLPITKRHHEQPENISAGG